jgi:hypothetical protein
MQLYKTFMGKTPPLREALSSTMYLVDYLNVTVYSM